MKRFQALTTALHFKRLKYPRWKCHREQDPRFCASNHGTLGRLGTQIPRPAQARSPAKPGAVRRRRKGALWRRAAVSSVGSRAGRAAAAGGFHLVGGAVQKSILLVIRLVCDGGWEAAAAPAPVLSAPEHGHRGDTGRAVSRDAPDGGYSPRASVTTRRFTAAETAQRDARSLADCGHNGAFADTN